MGQRSAKILVVDDEEQIVEVVKAYLKREGYEVFTAYDGNEALKVFDKESIDFIVLDLMLPNLSGEDVCKRVRIKSQVPILMLTAKVEEVDRINGLNIGADDYLIKPFSPKELVARVNAILRRYNRDSAKAEIMEFNEGDLMIDFGKMDVKKKGSKTNITRTEFEILALMVRNSGQVFSRDKLVEDILGIDFEGYDRTIDAHIKNIRHKIEDNQNRYIRTIYGIGYKFMGD